MGKPKGKTPSLLSMSTGTPAAHTSGKATPCNRCDDTLEKGAACFQIPKAKNGFTVKPIFCIACTTAIVEQTKSDIAKLEVVLKGHA